MRKKRLWITVWALILSLFGLVSAQPVLTSVGINPVAGDVFVIVSGSYVNPGNAGANQTWNLSGISPQDTIKYSVGTVVSAPNYSLFSNNSNIQMNNGNSYSFFHIDSAAFQNSGLAVVYQGLYMTYSNNEDVLHFPMSFNDTLTDGWGATYTVSTASFTRTGSNHVTYDGYGTVILPSDTFINVARIHLQETYSDASLFSYVSYTNDEYMWLANDFHQPVARLSTLTASSPTAIVQAGYYITPYNPVTSLVPHQADPTASILLFPNPASEFINITLNRPGILMRTIQLIDSYGRLVYNSDLSANKSAAYSLKTEDLAAGIYTARVTTQNGYVETKKVSIVK